VDVFSAVLRKTPLKLALRLQKKPTFLQILNTSSFINGEEGINNYGLVVAMTFVKPNINEIVPGLKYF